MLTLKSTPITNIKYTIESSLFYLPIVAETSSWGKKVSSVNLKSKELLPTFELPISNSFKVGVC
jgi:hypothetical protein